MNLVEKLHSGTFFVRLVTVTHSTTKLVMQAMTTGFAISMISVLDFLVIKAVNVLPWCTCLIASRKILNETL